MKNIDWEKLHFKDVKVLYGTDWDDDVEERYEVVTLWCEETGESYVIHAGWRESHD